jgi:hypothetical protein
LSETLVQEPTATSESEGSDNESSDNVSDEKPSQEKSFPRLDGEVFPLVAANAEVIVRCPWMGGAEVTLGDAMVSYPRIMTEEIADLIIADIYLLLANRVEESTEQEEDQLGEEIAEEEPDKKDKDKTNTKKESKKADTKTPSAKAVNGKHHKKPVIKHEKNLHKVLEKLSPKPIAKAVVPATSNIVVNQPATPAKNNKQFSKEPTNYEPKLLPKLPITNMPQLVESLAPAIPELANIISESEQPPASEKPIDEIPQRIYKEVFADKKDTQRRVELYEPQASESFLLAEKSPEDKTIKGDPYSEDYISIYSRPIPDNKPYETIAQEELKPVENLYADQDEYGNPSSTYEAEPVSEALAINIEPVIRIELENIIAAIDHETNPQEEVEELLYQLLNQVEISEARDVVKSLSLPAIKLYVAKEIEKTKKLEKTDKTLQDQGTHELIKKWVASVGVIKKAAARAAWIGKTALHLRSISS